MQPISYESQAAAMVGPERFWLVAELEALEDRDPVRVFVVWMCAYAGDVLRGVLPGPYEQGRAERFAREALMGAEEFIAVAHRPEAELAEQFNVPVEQVTRRLVDLADRLISR